MIEPTTTTPPAMMGDPLEDVPAFLLELSERELLLFVAHQLHRLAPLLDLMENPPPALAAMMGAL